MTTFVHTLNTIEVTPAMKFSVSQPSNASTLSLDDPALSVMTDLKKVRAITINPDNSIEFAQELMKHAGIRMLLVTNSDNNLLGLVTFRDIIGEKVINIIASDKVTRDQIHVSQVMTPLSELNPFRFSDIEQSTIKNVIAILHEAGRQHAIVIDTMEGNDNYFIRGIFSATHIGRLLGMEISSDDHVQSFAEFEKLMA
jgi:CBS domain-containing protein